MKLYNRSLVVVVMTFALSFPSTVFAQLNNSGYDYTNSELNFARAMAPTQAGFLPPDSPVHQLMKQPNIVQNLLITAGMSLLYVGTFATSNRIIANYHAPIQAHLQERMGSVFHEMAELVILNDDRRLAQYIEAWFRHQIRPSENGATRMVTRVNVDVMLTDREGMISKLFTELEPHVYYSPDSHTFELIKPGLVEKDNVMVRNTVKITAGEMARVVQCLQYDASPKIFERLYLIHELIQKTSQHFVSAMIERYGSDILMHQQEVLKIGILIRGHELEVANQIREIMSGKYDSYVQDVHKLTPGKSVPRYLSSRAASKVEYDSLHRIHERFLQRVDFKKLAVGGGLLLAAGLALYLLIDDRDLSLADGEKYGITFDDILAMYQSENPDKEQLKIFFTEFPNLAIDAAIFADTLKAADQEVRQFDKRLAALN